MPSSSSKFLGSIDSPLHAALRRSLLLALLGGSAGCQSSSINGAGGTGGASPLAGASGSGTAGGATVGTTSSASGMGGMGASSSSSASSGGTGGMGASSSSSASSGGVGGMGGTASAASAGSSSASSGGMGASSSSSASSGGTGGMGASSSSSASSGGAGGMGSATSSGSSSSSSSGGGMSTCPLPPSSGAGSTWNDCNVGFDPTKSGGDLLWVKATTMACGFMNEWSLYDLATGPTGDVALAGYCIKVGGADAVTAHFNGAAQDVGGFSFPQGGTGNLSLYARFGQHGDLAVFSSRFLATWDHRLRIPLDGVAWNASTPTPFGPWDSDALGNYFVAVDADQNHLTFGSTQLPAGGRYLIRGGPQGASFQASFTGALAADRLGGVYRSGALGGALDLGCGPMAPASPSSGFIARLDSAWGCVYSRALPAVAVVAASLGGVAILSATSSTGLDLGCGPLAAAPGGSTFVTGLDGAGSCSFGKSLPAPDLKVALDPSGRVVLSGFVGSLPVDLGGGPLQPLGSNDFVLAELDAAGNHLWSRRFGAPGVSLVTPQVSISTAGNVQLLTSFAGAVDLGGGVVTAASGDTVFASFAPSGQLRFARALPIAGAQKKSVDGCGALVVASTLTTFDPGCGQVLPVPPPPTFPPPSTSPPNLAFARFAP